MLLGLVCWIPPVPGMVFGKWSQKATWTEIRTSLHIAQPGHLLPLAFFWVEADSASTPEKCPRDWKGEVKKVDWEAFTHYSGPDSGHQAFTKGLLLVDNSCGSQRQALEITARDCQWRGRKGNEWIAVQNGEVLSTLDGKDYLSGFIVARKDGPKGHNHVRLNMQTKDGPRDIAVPSLSCRPQHHINLQMVMTRRWGAEKSVATNFSKQIDWLIGSTLVFIL